MQYREKSGQTLTEPVTTAEMLTYMGIDSLDDSNTTMLGNMITTARKWMEEYTGLSILSKSYEVRFYNEDAWDDYYELPFSPVSSITSVDISGTTVEYDEKGLDRKFIRPRQSVITNITSDEAYLDVEFVAGADNEQANMVLRRITAEMFNNRIDNLPDSPSSGLSFTTMKYLETLNVNTDL